MTTNNFNVGYVKSVGEVKATSTLFSPTRKRPLIKSVYVKISSDDNKNVGIHFDRKEAVSLIKKLQKALK